jgi:predicted glycosyltransferase
MCGVKRHERRGAALREAGLKRKVLVVTYGGGHVNALIPVIKELSEDPHLMLVVLGLSIAGPVLKREGIPFRTFEDYFDPERDNAAWKYGVELARKWHVPSRGVSLKNSIIYLGMSMSDLVEEEGEERARQLMDEKGRQAFLPLRTIKRIVQEEQPNLLVTGICPRAERAATLVCRKIGIPSLNLHDFLGTEDRHYLEADRIAVMSDITRENLIRRGQHPESIVVTGQPAFDSIVNKASPNREAVFRELAIDGARKAVVFATQPVMAENGDYLRGVLLALKELPRLQLIVKPHPSEDGATHRRLMGQLCPDAILTEMSVRDLIAVSDMLITFFSTVGIETVLLKKPLITLNLSGKPNPVPLADYGVAIEITRVEDIAGTVRRVLDDADLRARLDRAREQHFGSILDGKGTERVVSLIYDMLSPKAQLDEDLDRLEALRIGEVSR